MRDVKIELIDKPARNFVDKTVKTFHDGSFERWIVTFAKCLNFVVNYAQS